MASVRTTSPAAVRNVVSSTIVRSWYRLVTSYAPAGRIAQWPASASSSRAKIDGESNRGKHSQSTEPSLLTSAAECRSDSSA